MLPYVLFKDDWFLALYKPAGICTTLPSRALGNQALGNQGAAGNQGSSPKHRRRSGSQEPRCLVDWATKLDPGALNLHPTSRLDRDVSGIVTFARCSSATKALLEARQKKNYRRVYIGLASRSKETRKDIACSGETPEPAQGVWDFPIGIDPNHPQKRIVGSDTQPVRAQKQAITHYEVRHAHNLNAHTVVVFRFEPQTGRTHQLRLHAAHAGYALLGDRLYGGLARIVAQDGAVFSFKRVFLHCAEVQVEALPHDQSLHVKSSLPDDISGFLDAMRIGNAEGIVTST